MSPPTYSRRPVHGVRTWNPVALTLNTERFKSEREKVLACWRLSIHEAYILTPAMYTYIYIYT